MLRLLRFLRGIGALFLVFGSHDCGFVSLSCKRIVVDENWDGRLHSFFCEGVGLTPTVTNLTAGRFSEVSGGATP